MLNGILPEDVGAVVVFYNPDRACIERANRIANLCRCIVVDNTPADAHSPDVERALNARIGYLANARNVGIATALNQGLERLIAEGRKYALLFDQDSEPTEALVSELVRAMSECIARGELVAVVGPAYEDTRLRGVAPFVRFGYFRLKRIAPLGDVPIDVDFLITSGSCVNLGCWSDVGRMDDSLFIDFVDTEWCIRARSRGYRVVGIPWIKMQHELGEEPIRALGRSYPMHSPVRHYYLFRNAVALLKRSYVPWTWKSTELVKLPVRLVIYALYAPDARAHLTMALRGIRHGWAGRMGML
ncbi:glycosyltransferase family 2 protein [Burkholderia multivorans]|uniref:glycosyltransferase family 2 protein n=1 Tax=Burkholderia multivorans TaxID=87883 RepID=UPI000CFE4174|nr:glycosyltransferase family 2 protein [Burkholderia multivorans]MBN7130360.1 glycosyltransferase family 2 protein [Burkholderia multivorans]MBN8169611.1 glycosyltransferase family 2 protein [Burkholderia multivorans]MBY4796657.1 glycosyltransferase family 2 protein [Burkholderia multivorans]MDN7594043.1 glycosyltransferase family 2 protein [Burkholderia multivorans]PRE22092.1 glycosyltransferase family 2 protein [Burkholderia multivorans]